MDMTRYYHRDGERPLDVIPEDGGFFGIFRTVACIGDSLASGEMESLDEAGNRGYHDYFEYSWGQYMARAAGCKVYNFSRGGMTASEYIDSFGEAQGFWDPALAAQAYIVALGVNDLLNAGQPIGSTDDIDMEHPENNPKTFAGYYGALLAKYRKIAPKARLFLMTMPVSDSDTPENNRRKAAHRDLLLQIAEKVPFTYVLDFYTYAPVHDETFHRYFYVGGHLNAMGYLLTAQQVMAYVDYIIRNNPEDFAQAAFIGTEFHYHGRKW